MEGDGDWCPDSYDWDYISTHALTWRATRNYNNISDAASDFYPRPHMEGDYRFSINQRHSRKFLPTPSHGGRQAGNLILGQEIQFLPTPSHGGRPHSDTCLALSSTDFYPRPHMEGDLPQGLLSLWLQISTHALTWRATFWPLYISARLFSFLPTPSHGGRLRGAGGHVYHVPPFLPTPSHGGRPFCASNSLWISYFYPRPHMEGDAGGRSAGGFRADISTHALTWRATNCSSSCLPVSLYFYPRPHMEGDRRQHKGREKE